MSAMKYGPAISKAICDHVAMGVSQRDAAALEDIRESTFYQWVKDHPEFSEALEKARLRCKARNIKIIQKAAITKWTAAAWHLERNYPQEFALRLQHTGAKGRPLIPTRSTMDLSKVDDATLKKLAALVADADSGK